MNDLVLSPPLVDPVSVKLAGQVSVPGPLDDPVVLNAKVPWAGFALFTMTIVAGLSLLVTLQSAVSPIPRVIDVAAV